MNVNTKYAYVAALQDKTSESINKALDIVRKNALDDGRPITVLQTDNGKEFQNKIINNWASKNQIEQVFCDRGDKNVSE